MRVFSIQLFMVLQNSDIMLIKTYEKIDYKICKGLKDILVDILFKVQDNKAKLYQNIKNNEDYNKQDCLEENFENKNFDIETICTNISSN